VLSHGELAAVGGLPPKGAEELEPTYGLDELEWNLARVPSGFVTLTEVPFDVRGVIRLSRAAWGCAALPTKVEIAVGRKFRRMHVLRGTLPLAMEGEPVGTYRLHYHDGSSAELPIVYGRDVRAMGNFSTTLTDIAMGWARVSEAELAWFITSTPTNPGMPLYRRTYENPAPAREVVSISFESAVTTSGPFLLALTVEP
jgi:hypothetical protein